jgi:hypothetical protein
MGLAKIKTMSINTTMFKIVTKIPYFYFEYFYKFVLKLLKTDFFFSIIFLKPLKKTRPYKNINDLIVDKMKKLFIL